MKGRFANFGMSLLAIFLLVAAVPAKADSDDGIVRVKSAVPMAEAMLSASRVRASPVTSSTTKAFFSANSRKRGSWMALRNTAISLSRASGGMFAGATT